MPAPFYYDEPYLAAPVDIAPAEGGACTVHNHGDGRVHTLPAALGLLLAQAARFRTGSALRERVLAAGWPAGEAERIPAAAEALLEAGLLHSRSAFLERLRRRAEREAAEHGPTAIAACGWVTRERPGVLARGVASLIAHNRTHGRSPAYRVYDDSRTDSTRAAVRQALRDVAAQTGEPIGYCGRPQKERFVARLSDAAAARGVPAALLRWALLPDDPAFSTGANHNLAHLDSVGTSLLMSDDDMVFAPARLPATEPATEPDAAPGLTLAALRALDAVRPATDMAAAEAAVQPVPDGLLAAHEALLGRPLGALLPAAAAGPPVVDLAHVTPELAAALTAHGARVRVTTAGSYGDTGMNSQKVLLVLQGRAREALGASEAQYRALSASHVAVNIAARTTLVAGGAYLAMNVALDLRSPLPPCMPLYRGHDGVFAAMVRLCDGRALLGHLPLGLHHLPEAPRTLAHERIHDATVAMSGFLLLLLESAPSVDRPPAPGLDVTPDAGLRRVGAHLAAAAALPTEAFRERARARWHHHASAMATHLEGLLAHHRGEPRWWAADVRQYIANLRASREDPTMPLPLEWRDPARAAGGEADRAAGWDAARAYVAHFADLIAAWPEITAAAAELKAAGVQATVTA